MTIEESYTDVNKYINLCRTSPEIANLEKFKELNSINFSYNINDKIDTYIYLLELWPDRKDLQSFEYFKELNNNKNLRGGWKTENYEEWLELSQDDIDLDYLKTLNPTAFDYSCFCDKFRKGADYEYFISLGPSSETYLNWCLIFRDNADYEYFISLNPVKYELNRWFRMFPDDKNNNV